MRRILVCDDDRDIVKALEIYLKSEGYEVVCAENGKKALLALEENPDIHLVLMDIMMPEMDGLHAIMRIRERRNIPVILLTAKSEDGDKILGLNLGADDYVTKPFSAMELMARVKSQLRRYVDLGSMKKSESLLKIGGISLDDEKKIVTAEGESVNVTPIEYKILHLLMKNPERVFSSGQIYEAVWQEPSFGSEKTVAVHIRHLREKIEIDPTKPRYLKVIWGLGYKMGSGDRGGL